MTAPTSPRTEGRFTTTGAWSAEGFGSDRVTADVWGVVRARKATKCSPREIANHIAKMPQLAEAFPAAVLEEWARYDAHDDWPLVPAHNSAQDAVKRAGDGGKTPWPASTPVHGPAPELPRDLFSEARQVVSELLDADLPPEPE